MHAISASLSGVKEFQRIPDPHQRVNTAHGRMDGEPRVNRVDPGHELERNLKPAQTKEK